MNKFTFKSANAILSFGYYKTYPTRKEYIDSRFHWDTTAYLYRKKSYLFTKVFYFTPPDVFTYTLGFFLNKIKT